VEGVQQPEQEVGHSSALSAEVKNEWNCIPTPCVCLRGVNRDIFTFYVEARMCEHSLHPAAGYTINLKTLFFSLNSMYLFSLLV
jgi:hypothetical protein